MLHSSFLRLSLVAVSRSYSLISGLGLLTAAAFVAEHRLQAHRLQCLQASVAVAREFSICSPRTQQMWHTGLVAPRRVGSSQTRDQTHVPGTGRQTLIHGTARQVQLFLNFKSELNRRKNISTCAI